MLTPVIALITWTLIVWLWMYALRIPAMQAAGTADATNVGLAWTYVGLRVVHSLVQNTINRVAIRFMVFSLSSLALVAITVRCLLAL